jgi:hypothetical protein
MSILSNLDAKPMDPYPYGKCAVCGWHGPRAELKKGAPGIEHCPQCNSDDTTWTAALLPQSMDAESPQAEGERKNLPTL